MNVYPYLCSAALTVERPLLDRPSSRRRKHSRETPFWHQLRATIGRRELMKPKAQKKGKAPIKSKGKARRKRRISRAISILIRVKISAHSRQNVDHCPLRLG